MTAPAITAVRTWNRTGSKATVTVTLPDGTTLTAGGKRAARAAAVILTTWDARPLGLYGLRGDLQAAEVEAVRLSTATTSRTRGRYGIPGTDLTITPARQAIAVTVSEAPASAPAGGLPVIASNQEESTPVKSTKAAKPATRKVAPAVSTPEAPKRATPPPPSERPEYIHAEAVIAAAACPTCKARKGRPCTAPRGAVKYVHGTRLARVEVTA